MSYISAYLRKPLRTEAEARAQRVRLYDELRHPECRNCAFHEPHDVGSVECILDQRLYDPRHECYRHERKAS